MKKLIIGEEFSREDVYKILDNGPKKFTRGAGTWGIQGIVKVPNRQKDYVFFVTYGQDKLGQEFKEEITIDNIIEWKSQQKMDLSNPHIKNFINHNHELDNIYLFYRENNKSLFTFKGKLAYISHDENSNNPVIFKWKVLDNKFKYQEETVENYYSFLKETEERFKDNDFITLTEPPTPDISQHNDPINDIDINPILLSEIGLIGEMLVIEHIKNSLKEANCSHLLDKVIHTSVVEGDGAGYDIKYINKNNEIRYVEVKTTINSSNSQFFVTKNELNFSISSSDNYELYRLYNLSLDSWKAKAYLLTGSIMNNFDLNAYSFTAKYKKG